MSSLAEVATGASGDIDSNHLDSDSDADNDHAAGGSGGDQDAMDEDLPAVGASNGRQMRSSRALRSMLPTASTSGAAASGKLSRRGGGGVEGGAMKGRRGGGGTRPSITSSSSFGLGQNGEGGGERQDKNILDKDSRWRIDFDPFLEQIVGRHPADTSSSDPPQASAPDVGRIIDPSSIPTSAPVPDIGVPASPPATAPSTPARPAGATSIPPSQLAALQTTPVGTSASVVVDGTAPATPVSPTL